MEQIIGNPQLRMAIDILLTDILNLGATDYYISGADCWGNFDFDVPTAVPDEQ